MDKASHDNNGLKVLYDADTNPNDVILASTLLKVSALTNTLPELRKEIGLIESLEPPVLHDFSSLKVYIDSALDKTQAKQAGLWAIQWLKKFSLSDNWYTPLVTLAITDCLPIPEDPPIVIIPPRSKSGIVDILNRMERGNEHAETPLIAFQYAISIKELQQYLSKHSEAYLKSLSGLTAKKRTRITLDTLNIGHAVSLLKDSDTPHSWAQIRDEINPLLPSNLSVNEVDCRNSYKAYHKTITAIASR